MEFYMALSFSVSDTRLWPSLAQTMEELSRKKALNRDTFGADVMARTMDRMNGMERTGAVDVDQMLFGGIVAGDNMDYVINGNFVPRDAITQTTDAARGMLTLHLGTGHLLDSQV